MKSTIEIMREILDNCEGTEGPDEVRANTHIVSTLGEIQKCMSEYAKEVLQSFVDKYEDSIEIHYRTIATFKEQL